MTRSKAPNKKNSFCRNERSKETLDMKLVRSDRSTPKKECNASKKRRLETAKTDQIRQKSQERC